MFKCEISGVQIGPREKQYKIPIKTRIKTYTNLVKEYNEEKRKYEKVEKVTQGIEIVREANVCEAEYLNWRNNDSE